MYYFDLYYYNKQVNEKFISGINFKIKYLLFNPRIYQIKFSYKNPIRAAVFMSYLLLYKINENDNEITILQVFNRLEDYGHKIVE